MNVESINPSTWSWRDFIPAAVLIAGAVSIAAFAGIAASEIEQDRRAENQAVVSSDLEKSYSYFEKSYGLTLEQADLYSVNHADEKDIIRSVRATDGNLKHVLFRVVDVNVVPHLLDSSSTWIPMPVGETR